MGSLLYRGILLTEVPYRSAERDSHCESKDK